MTETVDIDALLAKEFGDRLTKPKAVKYREVTIFGQKFRVKQDVNTFNAVRLNDPAQVAAAVASMFVNIIHENDRRRFTETMAAQDNLDDEVLMFIFNSVVEAAAGDRPTDSSPASRTTTQKRAVAKRSAARSSGRA